VSAAGWSKLSFILSWRKAGGDAAGGSRSSAIYEKEAAGAEARCMSPGSVERFRDDDMHQRGAEAAVPRLLNVILMRVLKRRAGTLYVGIWHFL
jgi:hypothetical protein